MTDFEPCYCSRCDGKFPAPCRYGTGAVPSKIDLDSIRARCSQSITEIVDNPREYYRVQQILRDRTDLLAEVERLLSGLRELAFHAESCCLPEVKDMQKDLTRMAVDRARSLYEGKISHETNQSRAAQDVLAERARQVSSEGWTPEHDDSHSCGALALAGAAYAANAGAVSLRGWARPHSNRALEYQRLAARLWPFDKEWWKPKNRRHDLVRAAALLLAEIERLDRWKQRAQEKHSREPTPSEASSFDKALAQHAAKHRIDPEKL